MAVRASQIGMTLLLVTGILTACHADRVLYDDFGVAGYARLQGTVSHSDGSRFGSITIQYLCGNPEPAWFGGIATTNTQGVFDILVNPPGAGTLPASGTLVCEINAMAHDSVVARARATTIFSQNAAARPITTFALVEGQGIP